MSQEAVIIEEEIGEEEEAEEQAPVPLEQVVREYRGGLGRLNAINYAIKDAMTLYGTLFRLGIAPDNPFWLSDLAEICVAHLSRIYEAPTIVVQTGRGKKGVVAGHISRAISLLLKLNKEIMFYSSRVPMPKVVKDDLGEVYLQLSSLIVKATSKTEVVTVAPTTSEGVLVILKASGRPMTAGEIHREFVLRWGAISPYRIRGILQYLKHAGKITSFRRGNKVYYQPIG